MTLGGLAPRLGAILSLSLLLAACAGNLSSLPPLPQSETGPYTLGTGDRVRLQVFGQEELRRAAHCPPSRMASRPGCATVFWSTRTSRPR